MAQKLYEETSVQNIANAIRLKNGKSSTMKIADFATQIYGIPQRPTESIPSYVREEAKRLALVVKSHQSNNSVSFICVSDTHDAQQTIGENVAIRDCALGAYLVKQLVPIDFGIMLGDYIMAHVNVDNGSAVKAQFINAMRYVSYFADAMTQGNHDNGMAGLTDDFIFTTDALYARIGSNAINVTRPTMEVDRGYYYFDVPDKNFRVIVLNTNDFKGIAFKPHTTSGTYNDGHRVSVPQLQWFSEILASIPSGYRFIVCSHEPIHWFDYKYTDANNTIWDMAQNWRTILDAYCSGTSYSFTQDGQTVSGNFASSHNGICCGTYHGHTHNFIDGRYGDSQIVRCSTPNACNGRTNEYGSASSYGQSFAEKYGELDESGNRVTAYFKTAEGTTKDTAFVVNTIDFDDMILYSDYYGAGRNRVISLGEVVKYSVTSTIGEHITTTTIPTLVDNGSSLSINLTLDEGYSANVLVTMGGVDVTSTVYSNNVINIASVTGDVVITATALFSGNYVPVVGFTDDARWSAGDGSIRTNVSGHVAVNEINFNRATGSTVKFKLSGIEWDKDSNCVFVATKDGTFKGAFYLNSSNGVSAYGVTVTHNDDNLVVTFSDPEQTAYEGINGFKVSGYGSGVNAVIQQIN